ncbi:MAG TPA: biotin--[acetyl-CoA-carboxylase] ligase [Deltaproteobacteria bacterium]|nr:biotin--[acetyl-CoA-carboxylase] ligase [Deltaproteobacteria bacterium]
MSDATYAMQNAPEAPGLIPLQAEAQPNPRAPEGEDGGRDTDLARRVRLALAGQGVKAPVIHVRETLSTNSLAHSLARLGHPEGTVVIADSQTAGRGQFGRSWHSAEGKGLYLSVILKPAMRAARMSGITLVTAVCLAQALRDDCGIHACIKWPNDILARGKKLAGILTEISITGDELDHLVVGVGVNLDHEAHDFPPEIRDKATSIRLEAGGKDGSASFVAAFLEAFYRGYREFLATGFDAFRGRWNSMSAMTGKRVLVRHAGGLHLEGVSLGVDSQGALVVLCPGGQRKRVLSGEIELS